MTVTAQVGTLFLLMGVGYLLAKRGRLTAAALPQLSFLLLYVVTPCIIIDTLQGGCEPGLAGGLVKATAADLALYAVCALMCALFFRREAPDTRDTLRFSVVFGNTGFMGFPLIAAVLGQEALIYAMPVFVAFQVAVWTYGACLMGGREQLSLRKMLLSPPLIGIWVGLPLFFLGLRLPEPISGTLGYLSDLNTPLAMVVIGAQMAAADLPATFRGRRLYVSAALKLVVSPVLAGVLLLPFHLDPMSYTALVVLAGVPTAGVTSIFAQQFGLDTDSAAQSITLSTLLSIITLPVVAVLAQRAAGL